MCYTFRVAAYLKKKKKKKLSSNHSINNAKAVIYQKEAFCSGSAQKILEKRVSSWSKNPKLVKMSHG
jgi:hypothetical protein